MDHDTGKPGTPTHAGAVTFRRNQNKVVFLVISSSDNTSLVLPKGHIEAGESPEEAAVRELREEAGVTGRIVGVLSKDEFETVKKKIIVQYFLVECLGFCNPKESRTIYWADKDAALELLSFDGLRKLLREGSDKLEESLLSGR